MALPAYYNPETIGQIVPPQTAEAIAAGTADTTPPADDDTRRIALLLIDMQIDFIHADGALSVPGALDDTRRTVEWLYDNVGSITTIFASLDSHLPIQIFSPAWWATEDGTHPAPYTAITSDDVASGQWRPLYQVDWSKDYVQRLEQDAKKQLMIWPYHTLIGTPGHDLVPAVYEAIAYHSAARQTQPIFVQKGTIPQTEYYSLFEPEVKVPLPGGSLNTDLLNQLATYATIYITGQAKSHCVMESVTSMMTFYADQPEMIERLHVLLDTTSAVAHPEIDFDAMAMETFDAYASKGLKLTKTTAD